MLAYGQSTLSLSGDENGGMLERTAGVSGETTSSKVDWVPCPVCGSTIRGEDYMINSHLGIYLFIDLFCIVYLILIWLRFQWK